MQHWECTRIIWTIIAAHTHTLTLFVTHGSCDNYIAPKMLSICPNQRKFSTVRDNEIRVLLIHWWSNVSDNIDDKIKVTHTWKEYGQCDSKTKTINEPIQIEYIRASWSIILHHWAKTDGWCIRFVYSSGHETSINFFITNWMKCSVL